uniref:Uncharacterized protein n=1 Tax=Chlamydomonas leiostraca TaxID=1034604 RepID=A0A7S0WWZ0_9CHLO
MMRRHAQQTSSLTNEYNTEKQAIINKWKQHVDEWNKRIQVKITQLTQRITALDLMLKTKSNENAQYAEYLDATRTDYRRVMETTEGLMRRLKVHPVYPITQRAVYVADCSDPPPREDRLVTLVTDYQDVAAEYSRASAQSATLGAKAGQQFAKSVLQPESASMAELKVTLAGGVNQVDVVQEVHEVGDSGRRKVTTTTTNTSSSNTKTTTANNTATRNTTAAGRSAAASAKTSGTGAAAPAAASAAAVAGAVPAATS